MTDELRKSKIKSYIKIARLDHWVKQMFIAPGVVLALFIPGILDTIVIGEFLITLLLGFLATCFIASANYVINEWLDRDFDKFHPVKKNRPCVAADLRVWIILLEYFLFTLLGVASAAGIFILYNNWLVLVVVGVLWVMGIVYNVRPMRTKEIPYLDVLSESLNNALRLLIGWFVVTAAWFPALSIVIAYWMGGAFLMATKRFAEYRMINNPETAALYRKSFKHYTEKSLLVSSFIYSLLSVCFITIFFVNYKPELIFSIIPLCLLFGYYFLLAYKPDSVAQKPEKLLREWKLMIIVGIFLVAFCVALVAGGLPSEPITSHKEFINIIFNNFRI